MNRPYEKKRKWVDVGIDPYEASREIVGRGFTPAAVVRGLTMAGPRPRPTVLYDGAYREIATGTGALAMTTK